MKTLTIIFIIIIFTFISFAQNTNSIITEVKTSEVSVKLNKLLDFTNFSTKPKDGNKFIVAEITLENLTDKTVAMGSEYTMSITVKDANGNEYRSGLKGAGIVASYLTKNTNYKQDQSANKLAYEDKFPAKTKAKSLLCGFEIPKEVKIVSFGVKKKNMWSAIK
jgi:hypothetical protein